MKSPPTGESAAPAEAVRPIDESARMKLYKRESLWKPHIAQGEVAIIDMDLNGFITYLSPKALSMYGWDEVDIIDKHVSILYSTCDTAHGKAAYEVRAAEKKGAFSSFAWQRRKNEQQFWSYAESQVVTNDTGQRVGIRKLIVELDLSVIKYKTSVPPQQHQAIKHQGDTTTEHPLKIGPSAQALIAACRHQWRGFQY